MLIKIFKIEIKKHERKEQKNLCRFDKKLSEKARKSNNKRQEKTKKKQGK